MCKVPFATENNILTGSRDQEMDILEEGVNIILPTTPVDDIIEYLLLLKIGDISHITLNTSRIVWNLSISIILHVHYHHFKQNT